MSSKSAKGVSVEGKVGWGGEDKKVVEEDVEKDVEKDDESDRFDSC